MRILASSEATGCEVWAPYPVSPSYISILVQGRLEIKEYVEQKALGLNWFHSLLTPRLRCLSCKKSILATTPLFLSMVSRAVAEHLGELNLACVRTSAEVLITQSTFAELGRRMLGRGACSARTMTDRWLENYRNAAMDFLVSLEEWLLDESITGSSADRSLHAERLGVMQLIMEQVKVRATNPSALSFRDHTWRSESQVVP